MTHTYKYRLYPRRSQKTTLDDLLHQSRLLYNSALEQRIAAYKEQGERLSYPDQWNYFRDERNAHSETMGKLNATSVQQLLRRLDKSFKAFFRRIKNGDTPGFPRFKGTNRFHSLEYRYGDGCKLRLNNRPVFYIQNVGEVKVKYHRPISDDAKMKHVVIKKGSHRRRKAAYLVAKIHERIQNQRLDFWHKTTHTLAESYSLIAIENLTLDFMLKNHHLALSAADAGLGMFRQLLSYKAEDAGTKVVAVNPKNTTQACSQCGRIVPKSLRERVHRCSCGLVMDRDINAAINILNLAQTEPSGANVGVVNSRVA